MNVRFYMTANINAQDQSDDVEVVTDGTYEENPDGTIYLSYEETGMIGAEETTTKITVEKDLVTVSRLGGVSGVMKFSKGETNHLFYNTPFGGSALALTTHEIKKVFEDGMLVDLFIDYTLEFENAAKSDNTLNLKIKKI